jgi:TetR/AcrR family transcriptional regulator, transcriptional repressor for nem operon
LAAEVAFVARQSKREQIVEAALDRFHAHGFNGTGVKDITDTAGVPKGSFYNHFDSKEALAVVALERYAEAKRMSMLTDTTVEPLARLRAHFAFLRDEVIRDGLRRGCMLGNFGTEIVDHSDPIRASVRAGLDAWAGLIAAALAEAQRGGAVRADLDPGRTARFVLNAWEGTLIDARTGRSTDAFDSFFTLVFDTLLS